jgi:hypothetical protein
MKTSSHVEHDRGCIQIKKFNKNTRRGGLAATANNRKRKMSILIVTGIEGARSCAEIVGERLGMQIEVDKLRVVADLANNLRQHLSASPAA